MKDRLERFVLLPFSAGCICESSIPVVTPHPKRSKQGVLFRGCEEKRDEEEEEEERGEEKQCLDDEESLSGQNWKTTLPRFQKLFKNFKNLSQLFVYKDELEQEMGMEIGLPTDVKHVTHIGLDGSASSVFSDGWKSIPEQELINLHSFRPAETPNMIRLLETECSFHNNVIA